MPAPGAGMFGCGDEDTGVRSGPGPIASEPVAFTYLTTLPSHPTNPTQGSPDLSEAVIHLIRRHFQLAAKAAQDLMWDWDLVTGELVWAGTTEAYFQLSPDRLAELKTSPYQLWAERVHPDDIGAAEAAARAAIAAGAESWQHEYRYFCGDRAVSYWTVTGKDARGETLELKGCDLYTFENRKIKYKDTFWKQRT